MTMIIRKNSEERKVKKLKMTEEELWKWNLRNSRGIARGQRGTDVPGRQTRGRQKPV